MYSTFLHKIMQHSFQLIQNSNISFDLFFIRREFCQGRKLCVYTMPIVRHTMQTLMETKWMLTSLKHSLEGQRHILLVCEMNNGFNIHWFIGGQPVYFFFSCFSLVYLNKSRNKFWMPFNENYFSVIGFGKCTKSLNFCNIHVHYHSNEKFSLICG